MDDLTHEGLWFPDMFFGHQHHYGRHRISFSKHITFGLIFRRPSRHGHMLRYLRVFWAHKALEHCYRLIWSLWNRQIEKLFELNQYYIIYAISYWIAIRLKRNQFGLLYHFISTIFFLFNNFVQLSEPSSFVSVTIVVSKP